MSVVLKRVLFDNNGRAGLVLCMNKDGYYINHFGGINGTETLISDIKDRSSAKQEFLELAWEMS